MKRVGITLAIIFVLLLALVVSILPHGTDPNAPRYVPLAVEPTGPVGEETFDWGGAVPFQDGCVWISTYLSRSNAHCYLYDLEQHAIRGTIVNAYPVLANRPGRGFSARDMPRFSPQSKKGSSAH